MKRPAAGDWQSFASDDGPDSTPVTMQQRHVFNKNFENMPDEVKEAWSKRMGTDKIKSGYQIINSIVPRDAGYGHELTINSRSLTRFRKITARRAQTSERTGYTFTQIISPSLLGSESALNEGIKRGDVTQKVKGGRTWYFLATEQEKSEQEDETGGTIQAESDDVNESLFQKLMQLGASSISESWCRFAIKEDTAAPSTVNDQQMKYVHDACEGCTKALQSCRRQCAAAGPSAAPLIEKAKIACNMLQQEGLQSLDSLIWQPKESVNLPQVKAAMLSAAKQLAVVLQCEKAVKAVSKVSS